MSTSTIRRFSLMLCFVLWGCGKSEQHYNFEGRVVSKVAETHTLVVDHGIIPGFMPAMTMPYPVAAGVDLSRIEPGDRIKARVVVRGDDEYELDKVTVTDSSRRERTTEGTGQLYPGELIPDVPLLDQDGKTVRLSDFRGKSVLTFLVHKHLPWRKC